MSPSSLEKGFWALKKVLTTAARFPARAQSVHWRAWLAQNEPQQERFASSATKLAATINARVKSPGPGAIDEGLEPPVSSKRTHGGVCVRPLIGEPFAAAVSVPGGGLRSPSSRRSRRSAAAATRMMSRHQTDTPDAFARPALFTGGTIEIRSDAAAAGGSYGGGACLPLNGAGCPVTACVGTFRWCGWCCWRPRCASNGGGYRRLA